MFKFLTISCSSKKVYRGDKIASTDIRLDRHTEWMIPIYPLNFVCGGIKKVITKQIPQVFLKKNRALLERLERYMASIVLCIFDKLNKPSKNFIQLSVDILFFNQFYY